MLHSRHILGAAAHGLLVALVAPPIAAAAFLVISASSSASGAESFDTSFVSLLLLFLGAASGAYLLGAIPAFAAGTMLPLFRLHLTPVLTAVAAGIAGAVAYLLTFGFHLLSGPRGFEGVHVYVLPAFVGVAVASLAAQRILRRPAEA